MKRLFLCIILATIAVSDAMGQNVIIGERLPSEIRARRWLMDMPPDEADFTCLLFYHSESEVCQRSLEAIKPLVEQYGKRLNLVIITKEQYEDAGVTLTQHLDDRIGIAFDEEGRIFRQLGVEFIPFCVVVDHRRYAQWCGNGAMFTKDVMDKILTTER